MDTYDYAIEIENLCKNYQGFALKNVGFKVPKGSIMGFIGQNGAGKTTTIKALLNMIKKDSGSIRVFDKDTIEYETDIKENIGVVFDEMGFHKSFTPVQINIMFRNIYKNWNEELFFQYLERFGLPPKKKCGKFSRGMQMKLQIAVALSHNAKLLILDEPTSGLDPVIRSEILDVFLEYVVDGEHSILISSHITSDLERIADYITFINKGEVLLSDERMNILDEHAMIRCAKEDLPRIPKEFIVNTKISNFGAEVLVTDATKVKTCVTDLTVDKATLEEIMVFYVTRKE